MHFAGYKLSIANPVGARLSAPNARREQEIPDRAMIMQRACRELNLSAWNRTPYQAMDGKNENEVTLSVTLCDEQQHHDVVHTLAVEGDDPVACKKLELLGFNVRAAKHGSDTWRY